jgi:hypothetical protein
MASGRIADGGSATATRPVTPSPNGQYVLVNKVKKPFSHLMPMNGFAQDIEVWSRTGDVVKQLASLPSREGTPISGVETGPRAVHWRADQPATVMWTEALDGGDLKNKVPFRDKVVALAEPFTGQPSEVAKTEWRYGGINYTDAGIGLLNENDRATRRTRTWMMEPGAAPRKVWDRKQDAAYEDPGNPVVRRDSGTAGRGGGGGRGVAAPGASSARTVTVTVTLPSGESVPGRLVRIDDFLVTVGLSDGTLRTFRREGDVPKVDIRDPMKAHRDMLAVHTDKDMHDVTAYLVTLK